MRRPSNVWAIFWAALAIVALIMAMVSLPTSSADAATGDNGFVVTTVPGSQPGDGSAKVTVTLPITDSIPVTAVINGGGTFAGGATSLPFDLKGTVGKVVFNQAYQCATSSTTISVLDVSGAAYTTVPAQFKTGVCGEVTPPADSDGDGVADNHPDLCPGTPAGAKVDANGCSASQLDSDGDGVTNDKDQCPNTPAGVKVDPATGCEPVVVVKDSDGDGVPDATDRCPGTPAGAKVDANGCVMSLPPAVVQTGTKNATKDKDGTATFNVTNPNQVDITYQVNVNGVVDQSLTVPGGKTVSLVVNRPSGDYNLTLRAAGSVTNPISFTICQDGVVVTPPTVKPTPTPMPVVTPSPKPSSHPVTTPAPTKVVPQPVVTKAPTKAAIVVKQQPTKSATAKRINGVNFDTAVHDTTPTSSFVWFGVLAFALLGFVLCVPFRKKGSRV